MNRVGPLHLSPEKVLQKIQIVHTWLAKGLVAWPPPIQVPPTQRKLDMLSVSEESVSHSLSEKTPLPRSPAPWCPHPLFHESDILILLICKWSFILNKWYENLSQIAFLKKMYPSFKKGIPRFFGLSTSFRSIWWKRRRIRKVMPGPRAEGGPRWKDWHEWKAAPALSLSVSSSSRI